MTEREEFDAWYESGGRAVQHSGLTAQGRALVAFRAGWNAAKHTPTSILDGTISCKECRVLMLEFNQAGHDEWHAKNRP